MNTYSINPNSILSSCSIVLLFYMSGRSVHGGFVNNSVVVSI